MKTLDIDQLRPTQMTHGAREVRQKIKEYEMLSGHDLEMAIAEKPVPVVYGPGLVPYVIDHHHVAAALWHAGVKTVPLVLVRGLSAYSHTAFWLCMENERWTFPYGADGQRRAFSDLPRQVWEMPDDSYRSLVAAVRDAGAYEKTNVLLEEFRWADFFRARLPRPDSDEHFDAVMKDALRLARSLAALGLPGYPGPSN